MREPTQATAWVVVPCREHPSVLARAGPHLALPSVTFAAHRVPTDTSLAEALQESLGIDTHLVRWLDVVGAFGPDAVVLVAEVPHAPAPTGTLWIDRHQVGNLVGHAAAVERWFAEQAGAPPPAMRVPWYRPGWSEGATRWVDDALARLGQRRIGPLRPVTQTPYSAVSRLSSSKGELFLKAARPGEEHSAGVAALLAERAPGRVPGIAAVDPSRGWWLSFAVAGSPVADGTGTTFIEEALAVLAELQVASAQWLPDLASVGCPDLSLEVVAGEVLQVVNEDPVMAAFEADERASVAHAAGLVPAWCEKAAEAGVPACLQHGDFGAHNVLRTPTGPVLLDWRGWIGHPFVDIHLLLQNVGDPARRRSAWDAYLRPWTAGFARASLDEAAAAMEPVFNAQYLVQVGRQALAVAREPAAYEVWAGRQLSHNLRWFARRLVLTALHPP